MIEKNITVEDQIEYERRSLASSVKDAINYAAKHNVDTAVFRNEHGTHLDRELKYSQDWHGPFDVKFVALARFCHRKPRIKARNVTRATI